MKEHDKKSEDFKSPEEPEIESGVAPISPNIGDAIHPVAGLAAAVAYGSPIPDDLYSQLQTSGDDESILEEGPYGDYEVLYGPPIDDWDNWNVSPEELIDFDVTPIPVEDGEGKEIDDNLIYADDSEDVTNLDDLLSEIEKNSGSEPNSDKNNENK